MEEISLFAFSLALVGLLNWLAGNRSFRGRELLIRRGPVWVASRWFGLGLWAASIVPAAQNDPSLMYAGLGGAVILLFGTARQAVKVADGNGAISAQSNVSTGGEEADTGSRRSAGA